METLEQPIAAPPPIPWPPDFRGENIRRYHMLKNAIEKPALRDKWIAYYRDNTIEWIQDWCITFDPRNERPVPRLMPFMLLPRQRDLVEFILACVHDKESGLIEKTRDMGASWICCCIALHMWLFKSGSVIGFGSRKEEYVDKRGDPKAIFTKIRQLIDHLPVWMLPEGFDRRTHDTHMKLINPANDCAITGECGDNIGRGGRTTVYFKDESAHYERPESIEAALGDNTNVQIDISSVNGSANVFYRRRIAGMEWKPGAEIPPGKTRVFVLDWRDHPAKTQIWYDRRKQKAIDEALEHIFAQEVDRDYSASVEGIIIKGEWARACIDAHIKLAHLGDWFAGEKMAGQDIADDGGDINAYASRHGVVLRRIEAWGGEAGEAAHKAIPFADEDKITELDYDCIGVGTGFKVECNHLKNLPTWPQRLKIAPWDASALPLNPDDHVIPGDDESPLNKDVYENLKAQAWFAMAARCYKTYLAITQQRVFPISEMASLPSNLPGVHQLITELSQAVKKLSLSSGKTIVDKKPKGALSPNKADATIMCYHPVRELSIFDVL